MRKVMDQMGRSVNVPEFPQRIISIVPSQTELLYDLGLDNEVVGITKFCIHPEDWRKSKIIVGGTKQVHFDLIDELKPDLIIGNKEENKEGFIKQLSEKYPVWMSDVFTLDDALEMIEMIGDITGRSRNAEGIVVDVLAAFEEIKELPNKGSVVYLIWNDPIMAVGKSAFINDMLKKAGFDNALSEHRYPELSIERLIELKPDQLLLSSEPFPFKEKHLAYFSKALPKTKISIVDGEMFSWYGSRLIKSAEYFKGL